MTIFATCLRWDGDGMGTNEFKYFYHTFTMFLVVGWEIFEFEYFFHIFTMFFGDGMGNNEFEYFPTFW